MDDKTVKIMLQFQLDNSKMQAAKSELAKLSSEFDKLEKDAKDLKQAISVSLAHGDDTKKLEAELKRVETQMGKVADSARKINQSLDPRAATEYFSKMKDGAEKFAQIGGQLVGLGAAITAPFILSANQYVQTAGVAEGASSRWISSMQRIEEAQLRVGRSTTEILNPGLEKAAELAESLASAIEQNPQALQSVLGVGAGLTAAGATITGGAQLAGSLASLKQLQAAGGTSGALAGGALKLGEVALTASAVYLAGNIGLNIGNYLNKAIYGKDTPDQTFGDVLVTLGQASTLLPTALLSFIGLNDEYMAIAEKINPALVMGNWVKGMEAEQKAQMPDADVVRQETLSIYAAWQEAEKARKDFETQSGAERNQIVQDQAAERTRLEQTYGQQRATAVTSFLQSEARLEQDYYRQRQQLAASHGKEMARMEQDHQRDQRRRKEDFDTQSLDLTANRDALGLVRAQRSYETDRRRAEEDYRVQVSRRNQDYADQLSQMEANFALQRERRQADMEAKLAEMDEQRAAEMKKLDERNAEVLKKLDERNARELKALQDNEQKRYRVLTDVAVRGISEAQSLAIQASQTYLSGFRAWLAQQMSTPLASSAYSQYRQGEREGRANGGYMEAYRTYDVAEAGYEFVLDNASTRAAERLMGRRLNQEDLIQKLATGAGRQSNNVNVSFPGGLITAPQLESVLRLSNDQLADRILGALA